MAFPRAQRNVLGQWDGQWYGQWDGQVFEPGLFDREASARAMRPSRLHSWTRGSPNLKKKPKTKKQNKKTFIVHTIAKKKLTLGSPESSSCYTKTIPQTQVLLETPLTWYFYDWGTRYLQNHDPPRGCEKTNNFHIDVSIAWIVTVIYIYKCIQYLEAQ